MRRSSTEEAVDDLRSLLGILRAFDQREQRQGKSKHLPGYAYAILVGVAMHPEGAAMRDLRDEFRVTHTSIGRMCRALAGLGLVRIGADPTDRRRSLVKLTPHGQRVIDGALAAFRGPPPPK